MRTTNTKINSIHNPYASHEVIVKLLPWYINKTLRLDESTKVESHLTVCFLCQKELAILKTLSSTVANQPFQHTNESLLTVKFSKLSAEINGSLVTQKDHTNVSKVSQKAHGFKLGRINLQKPALAIAASIFIAVLLPRLTMNNSVTAEFQTLSNAEIASVQKDSIRVIFLDDSKKQDINNLVSSINGHITNGPTEQGEYAVTVEGEVTATKIQNVIENLKKDSNVLFAEPAYAMLSSGKH